MVRRVRSIVLGMVACVSCSLDASGVGESGSTEASSSGTTGAIPPAVSSTGPVDPDGSTTAAASTSTGPDPTVSSDGTTQGTSEGTTGDTEPPLDTSDTETPPETVEYCAVANLPIPDDDVGGVSSSINVDLLGGGTIVSLQLVIEATHTFVGDLRFDLTKGGSSLIVIDQPGGGACSGNDIDVVLHDGGTGPVQTQCLNDGEGTPAIGGELQPEIPFDPQFTGNQMIGTWRLRAIDRAANDTGTLGAWCLRIAYR